ncbi:universal stress protein [Roseovarius amoyensis]|uniref:universal stress protein n=1 Tax=Roseovarius amoyensis TaxID=2211448 RepID=UPI000DBE8EF0|nr:universal stress protein [Roseovarius amoyensis]
MFKRILLAVDINAMEGAERLAEATRLLAGTSGAEIHVVNVVPTVGMPMVGAAFGADHNKAMLAEVKTALEEWTARALPEGARAHLLQGTIYDCVIRLSKQIGADAIVVGAHRPELRDYLVGPNAARIVRHAEQSVLVVRQAGS